MEPPRKKQATSSSNIEHSSPLTCIASTAIMTTELQWTVQEFGKKCKDMGNGEFITSPSFHAPKDESAKWIVHIFPNGDEMKKGGISFDVGPLSSFEFDFPTISIAYSLTDVKTKETLWSKTVPPHTFLALRDECWGYDSIPKEKFLSVENVLVCCKLKYEVKHMIPPYGNHSDLATDISRYFFESIGNGDVIFAIGEKKYRAHNLPGAPCSPPCSSTI